MNLVEIQTLLRLPYDRKQWVHLLREVLPSTEFFQTARAIPASGGQALAVQQIARIPLADQRTVAVLEVEVVGKVDLQRNRVGLRNLVAKFIDQEQAHAVLGLFRGEEEDYRFSYVSRTSAISADGDLSRVETEPRRFTYILGGGQACRTPAERLNELRGRETTLDDLTKAFRVEPLFKEFFQDYRTVFEGVENLVRASLPAAEPLRLFTQRLFNRLLFLAFVGRKGWLQIGERKDYLAALWDMYSGRAKDKTNFYRDHLIPLFFEGLNRPERRPGESDKRFGRVPYLNGGLFEKAEDGTDNKADIVVPDAAFKAIFEKLFSRYNFTVAESTPLDVEVAVDPEMLGKVFEELVTGRHEQGSYYTPKPIVSFMCRESLLEHLADRRPQESREALEAFVHEHQAGGLRNPEAVLTAIREVTVCDPACGSGAYLLGMMHELIDLRSCLFATNQKLDSRSAHERKLEIIERNLYGVDKDSFAVNIARLRLWLSLAVEYEGQAPPPLPNLDFKIEQGDSLAGPAPGAVFTDLGSVFSELVREYRRCKDLYLRAHGVEKQDLDKVIEALREKIAGWLATDATPDAFQWAIEFAEVFLPTKAPKTIGGKLNLGDELAPPSEPGGFDIVVANPPYVRMELIKPQKPVLRRRFPQVHSERADLYIYFYARAHELLRKGGVGAFISSNKWLRAGYGEPLRRHLLDEQAFTVVMDFGELGVFEAAADAAIFLWVKKPRGDSPTRWAMVKELNSCYADGVRQHFNKLAVEVPASQFGTGNPRLATSAAAGMRTRMERSGPRLGEICKGQLGWGAKTGLNEAFLIDQHLYEELLDRSSNTPEIIKPMYRGEDIRRYELHDRGTYIIYAYHGVDIDRYPYVKRHLQAFRRRLEKRATNQEWYELQQPQRVYEPLFVKDKIVYPDIGKECRFSLDTNGRYLETTGFCIGNADPYLLAVLNSSTAFSYFKELCAVLGDKEKGGRLRFKTQYVENLPIPDASSSERSAVGKLAEKVTKLHRQRRARVETFLKELGFDLTVFTSRNPIEQPWMLTPSDFARHAPHKPHRIFQATRDETILLTERIIKSETEINERVAALYGLGPVHQE